MCLYECVCVRMSLPFSRQPDSRVFYERWFDYWGSCSAALEPPQKSLWQLYRQSETIHLLDYRQLADTFRMFRFAFPKKFEQHSNAEIKSDEGGQPYTRHPTARQDSNGESTLHTACLAPPPPLNFCILVAKAGKSSHEEDREDKKKKNKEGSNRKIPA